MTSEHQELVSAIEGGTVRSGVKLEMTAKGPVQPKIAVYEGTSEEEMQRLLDIAVRTMKAAVNQIAVAGLSTPA